MEVPNWIFLAYIDEKGIIIIIIIVTHSLGLFSIVKSPKSNWSHLQWQCGKLFILQV